MVFSVITFRLGHESNQKDKIQHADIIKDYIY